MKREHRNHRCENGILCVCHDAPNPCKERGYCVCKCGATRGLSRHSLWIKSHATSPHTTFSHSPITDALALNSWSGRQM